MLNVIVNKLVAVSQPVPRGLRLGADRMGRQIQALVGDSLKGRGLGCGLRLLSSSISSSLTTPPAQVQFRRLPARILRWGTPIRIRVAGVGDHLTGCRTILQSFARSRRTWKPLGRLCTSWPLLGW